jgi:YidC/Oxa1 family membrane protein insertase
MREFFSPVLDAFSALLRFIHGGLEPVFGPAAWGWSIIVLTLIVRVALLPLAIKQTRSMKAMQTLQPQMKALQDKYKVDRDLMRRDPETYRARKQKLNEEMMALYQREGANPAASCLPLLAQAPVFIALFWTLNSEEALRGAPFYFITTATPGGLEKLVSAAGWPGWLLILIMSGTMFWSQKQMMARNAAAMANNPMAQQQKIMLYVLPVFLGAISFQFPLGILLYWVTTNAWQIAQQAIILRETRGDGGVTATPAASGSGGSGGGTARRSPGATSGRKKVEEDSNSAGRGSGADSGADTGRDGAGQGGGTGGSEPPARPSAPGRPGGPGGPGGPPRPGGRPDRLPRRGGSR